MPLYILLVLKWNYRVFFFNIQRNNFDPEKYFHFKVSLMGILITISLEVLFAPKDFF